MTRPRFIQIHSLHSYPAALLNRDDSGFAKRLPFGGASRTRVSSQCLKRHWRMAEDAKALAAIPGAVEAVRSRETVTRQVIGPLRTATPPIATPEVLEAVEKEFQTAVYGDKGGTKKGRQPLLLGLPEVAYLRTQAEALARDNATDAKAAGAAAKAYCKDIKANMKALREATALPGGLTAALFGRMVTSDTEANIDAAVHVAHAVTVHAEESESDYFSVVDDLRRAEDDAGADHIGDVELTSGLFYGYVVVDVPALISNLIGAAPEDWAAADTDRAMAAAVVDHLIHLIATVSPGAKRGSTAPYSYADLVLVEAGDRQPRTLANAFRVPVAPHVQAATAALAGHLGKLDAAYGAAEARRVMSLEDAALPAMPRLTLPDIAAWAASLVTAAEVQ